jgi:hypothetical protein
MKTPEEINEMAMVHAKLKPNFDRADEEYYNSTAINAYESFKSGYAQCQADNAETAIKFADWINKNDYEKIHGDRWCKKFMSFTHSTKELYDIYLIKSSLNK